MRAHLVASIALFAGIACSSSRASNPFAVNPGAGGSDSGAGGSSSGGSASTSGGASEAGGAAQGGSSSSGGTSSGGAATTGGAPTATGGTATTPDAGNGGAANDASAAGGVSSATGGVSGATGGTSSSAGGASNATGGSTSTGGAVADASVSAGGDGSSESACPTASPNDDKDGDGFSVAAGDCNDCDAKVNPGAIDVFRNGAWVDADCDGTAGTLTTACDNGLSLDDLNALSAAKAIDLCQAGLATNKSWGVISAAYVRAGGGTYGPGLQTGIEPNFGTSVNPQYGARMLALSTGHARTASQTGACGSDSCKTSASGTAPAGFPQAVPNCATPSATIADDVGLQVKLRVPTNATGFSFDFFFYSFEYPAWVCTQFNDQFVVLVNPSPTGSINGNVAFDAHHDPVSVNLPMPACDPSTSGAFATNCSGTCPAVPNPYCPGGASALAGTGFDTWGLSAGGTGWLTSTVPVHGGDEITVRFAIWDAGDQTLDSTVLIDDFKWITDGAVTVATVPK